MPTSRFPSAELAAVLMACLAVCLAACSATTSGDGRVPAPRIAAVPAPPSPRPADPEAVLTGRSASDGSGVPAGLPSPAMSGPAPFGAVAPGSAAPSEAAAPARPIRPSRPQPAEVRAMWVKRKTLASPEEILKLVDEAAAAGFNTLIAQVRARGDAMYDSPREPRADVLREQPADFDPLRTLLDAAHAKGLFVHAWMNTFFVANCDYLPEQPDHACNAHPDWLMVPAEAARDLAGLDPASERYMARLVGHAKANRQAVEGLYLSPAHPAARAHLTAVWMDVLERYDVDGLHFDFVRYPGPNYDYSPMSLHAFRAWLLAKEAAGLVRLEPEAAQEDRLELTRRHAALWDEFRREQVTLLVERISHEARALKPGVVLSAAVFPDGDDALKHRFQDWRGWVERGLLDAVCPMAYSTDTASFARRIAEARSAASAGKLWAGIGAYRMGPDSALEKIDAARRMGSDGFVLFSYETLGTEISGAARREAPAGYLDKIKTALQ